MDTLPPYLNNETMEHYRIRNNLPHVYVPFFPYGDLQVDWQVERQKKYPVVELYPYQDLQVSRSMEAVFVLFENEEQITENARVMIICHCSSYGREHAEKVVPSVEKLRELYKLAKSFS